MKKLITIWCFICIFFSCFPQIQPPKNEIITEKYTLTEYEVIDTIFICQLDSFIFKKECESLTDVQRVFFSMSLSNDDNDMYYIIEFIGSPYLHESTYGYFKYKEYIFILDGIKSDVFYPTNKNKLFIVEKSTIPIPQDFPMWRIKYTDNTYILEFSECW